MKHFRHSRQLIKGVTGFLVPMRRRGNLGRRGASFDQNVLKDDAMLRNEANLGRSLEV